MPEPAPFNPVPVVFGVMFVVLLVTMAIRGFNRLFSEDPPEHDPSAHIPQTTIRLSELSEFQGAGDRILRFSSGPYIAVITHSGTGYFEASAHDDHVELYDLLVAAGGEYAGTTLASRLPQYSELRVQASGAWTLSVFPWHDAEWRSGPVHGTGDAVFEYPASEFGYWLSEETLVKIRHRGDGGFRIEYFDLISSRRSVLGRSEILVYEIGDHDAEYIIHPGLFSIKAEGRWWITPLPRRKT